MGHLLKLTVPCLLLSTQLSADIVTFKVTFGELQERAKDYSGRLTLTAGEVVKITPWRFLDGDGLAGDAGWELLLKRRFFEDQPDRARHMTGDPRTENVPPAGVYVTVDASTNAQVHVQTQQGRFSFELADLRQSRPLRFLDDDVIAEKAIVGERVSASSPDSHFDYPSTTTTSGGETWVAWQGYSEGGDHVYARRVGGDLQRLTEQPTDVLRTAIGEDSKGQPWVVWSQRSGQSWHLNARSYRDGGWGPRTQITSGHQPNVFHRMVRDGSGNLHLVWVGHRDGRSYVYWLKYDGESLTEPTEISGPSAWVPEAAADSKGNLWVSWDSYRNGDYDIYLRKIGSGGDLGDEIRVTETPVFQTHPSIAVDGDDRVWLAWHESGANWGKDWTREDQNRSVTLYANRRPRVAIYDGHDWRQPLADPIKAVPSRHLRYVQYPRLAADRQGRVWLGLQVRTGTGHTRSDFWAFDGRWEFFLTQYVGESWMPAIPIAQSSNRPEGPLVLDGGTNGLNLVWSNDNRPLVAPGFYAKIPNNYEIFSANYEGAARAQQAQLRPFAEPPLASITVHPNEVADVKRIREYRSEHNGDTLQIVRGDFHRHTEISTDGSGDGSIEDYFRYMIDAASMETGIVGDHNIGNNDAYSWWRTEKAIDIFLIPGRYTPMFGYERSCGYPNGHRNVVFAQRGVPVLPIPRDEANGKIPTGPILYPYLRKHNGICMSHSTASSQGTDFRDWDEELEPLVELYQGYHASYEYPGAPRAESANYNVQVHGRYEPGGYWWDALSNGRKLGVQASSDHISNHASYTVVYTPSMSRDDILESMRKRHAYAATDNIIVDLKAESGGKSYMMGDSFPAFSAPKIKVKILGTDQITRVDLIKDRQFVYHSEPESNQVEFEFVDNNPGGDESYYYLRIEQRDRNMAWSSPIWVDYR